MKVSLRQLAAHLLKGELAHEKFCFATWNDGDLETRKGVNNCGTVGCAAGELPYLDKENWSFSEDGGLNYKSRESPFIFNCLGIYFGISGDDANLLFSRHEDYDIDDLKRCGIKFLEPNATKEQVANNIIQYCDYHKIP